MHGERSHLLALYPVFPKQLGNRSRRWPGFVFGVGHPPRTETDRSSPLAGQTLVCSRRYLPSHSSILPTLPPSPVAYPAEAIRQIRSSSRPGWGLHRGLSVGVPGWVRSLWRLVEHTQCQPSGGPRLVSLAW